MIFTPKQIIVHHDGVSRKGPSFNIINDYHKSIHFPLSTLGYYVGYHFWIERDGTLCQARRESEIGAHTVGQNYTGFGIGLAGNMDKEDPTTAQIKTLGALMSRLAFTYAIPYDQIFPHRKYAPKTCYGSRLSDTWAQEVFLQYEQQRIAEALKELGVTTVAIAKKKASGLVANIVSALSKS